MNSIENKNEILEVSIEKITIKLALPMLIGQVLIVLCGFSDSLCLKNY